MSLSKASVFACFALVAAAALPAQQVPPPAPVSVVEAVQTAMTPQTWVPGAVVSRNDARIAAEVPGQLTWVAEVGDVVARGAAVARIDDSALQLQLRNDDAQIRRLEADLEFVNQQLERRRQLAEEQIISTNDLEETESQRETAEQNVIAARVAREQTMFRLSRTTVRAPFADKIVERVQQPGGYTATGQDVVRLVDVREVEIQARAPLAVEPFLREGMTVAVEGRGRDGAGAVRRVIRVGDERSRMFEVRIVPDGDPWVVGSAVKVALPSNAPRDVIAVPRDALVLRSDAIYVFRIAADDTAERISVTTGIGDNSLIEVVGGVTAGDRVVVRGGERLRPGQAVAVGDG
ncbi:MAG: efflux RND transporter periplasmic adaptor subunit [Thermoanaerobaculia bacterium]